jgi:pyruvate/2-oxoglutarate dehydrogenase complex dihydrolipoamide acyltransferase (E2) component
VVGCLARTVREHPEINSLVAFGRLVTLREVTVSVPVERVVSGELVPEPVAIRAADTRSVAELGDLIRRAQSARDQRLGGLSGATWVCFVPSVLFRASFDHDIVDGAPAARFVGGLRELVASGEILGNGGSGG